MNKAHLIKEIAVQANTTIEEATLAIDKFEAAMRSFDEGKSSYELLVDNLSMIVCQEDDTLIGQEPLWVRNQQNKTFKRGKK